MNCRRLLGCAGGEFTAYKVLLHGPQSGQNALQLRSSKGINPMTYTDDLLCSFELYSDDELAEIQEKQDYQNELDSIPTFSELNPTLS